MEICQFAYRPSETLIHPIIRFEIEFETWDKHSFFIRVYFFCSDEDFPNILESEEALVYSETCMHWTCSVGFPVSWQTVITLTKREREGLVKSPRWRKPLYYSLLLRKFGSLCAVVLWNFTLLPCQPIDPSRWWNKAKRCIAGRNYRIFKDMSVCNVEYIHAFIHR